MKKQKPAILEPFAGKVIQIELPERFDSIRLLVQGEVPSDSDLEDGKPFVGKTGHWLRQNMLANAGVLDSQVLFDYTLRCQPPANKRGEHWPTADNKEAFEHCRFPGQWDQVPLRIPLLLLGGHALESRLGFDKISDYHGHVQFKNGRLVGVTFAPKAVMASPNLLPVAIRESANLLVAAANPSVLERPRVVKQFLPYVQGKPLVFDLEWNPGTQQLTVVGIAHEYGKAYSTFNVEAGLEVVQRHIDDGTLVIGHNLIDADIPKTGRLPKSWSPKHVFDTMIAGHLVHAHLAESGLLGLGDLVRFYDPTTDWKQEKSDLLLYNGYDNAYNFRLYERLSADLDATEQWHLVEKQQKLARLSSLMKARGVRIDHAALYDYAKAREEKRGNEKAEFGFNPDSPKQVREWLKEKGIIVSDAAKKTLDKLRGIDEEIDELIDYRSDSKSLTTWFPIERNKKKEIISVGNCTFPAFKPTGTAVARFSCADPNFQNLPPRLRRFVIPRDSELMFAAFDGSQIENRTVAWITDEKAMLAAFASGADFHKSNALNIQMMLQGRVLTLDDITKEQRQQGKTVTHATDYKETHFNLARRLFGNSKRESLDKAKRLQDAFYSAYPQIKRWHRDLEQQFLRGEVLLRNPFGRARFVYERTPHEFAKRAAHFLGCSTAADIINESAILVWEELGLLPVLIVHDELVYELPKGEAGLKIAKRIKEIMEHPIPEMGGFVIPSSSAIGDNYGKYDKDLNPGGLREVEL